MILTGQLKCIYFKSLLKLNIKTLAALFVRVLSGFTSTRLQTRNLKFNTALSHCSAAPRAVLNFLFLVCTLMLVNPENALQECCNP